MCPGAVRHVPHVTLAIMCPAHSTKAGGPATAKAEGGRRAEMSQTVTRTRIHSCVTARHTSPIPPSRDTPAQVALPGNGLAPAEAPSATTHQAETLHRCRCAAGFYRRPRPGDTGSPGGG